VGKEKDISDRLIELNQRLKAGNTGIRVELRGSRLSLMASLPDRTGKNRRSRRISPGTRANAAGLKEIEGLALRLAGDLARSLFKWSGWTFRERDRLPKEDKVCSDWIEDYQRYLVEVGTLPDHPDRNIVAKLKWLKRYWSPALKDLPQDEPLDSKAIRLAALQFNAINQDGKPTRSRQIACQVLGRFAKWAEIEVDLSPYKGSYSPAQVERNIPNDEAIAAAVLGLKHPGWRWVAGMMAAFGIRDHECWFAKLEQDAIGWICIVSDGKTGSRVSRPVPPEWVELFDLPNGKAPDIKIRVLNDYGDRTGKHFKRSGAGFAPYDLRHAYAIRSSVAYGIPVVVSAAHMGHSPNLHQGTYNKHIGEAQKREAYRRAINERKA
jgi:integrase